MMIFWNIKRITVKYLLWWQLFSRSGSSNEKNVLLGGLSKPFFLLYLNRISFRWDILFSFLSGCYKLEYNDIALNKLEILPLYSPLLSHNCFGFHFLIGIYVLFDKSALLVCPNY